MNKLEASQVVEAVGSIYTNYKPMNLELAIAAWEGIFIDTPYDLVMGALYSYAKDGNAFPPTPGQLNEIIHQAVETGGTSESEAWNMVLVAIRNGVYGAQEEFDRLPDDVQKAIGTPHYLHELAMSDNVNYGVESSNFYRNLRVVRERERNTKNIPEAVRERIDQITGQKQKEHLSEQAAARIEQKCYYEGLSEQAMERFQSEQPDNMTEDQKSFADMLRERLGMKREEENLDKVAVGGNDNSEEEYVKGWEGMFA